ncbi:hypothetical protein HPB48_014425 [Haemaphysalis longicornis]|uniref:Uncharacterized protein n=1 Tax=Haemaphysalis longicornis TaxID=44386 RepID=A0A9J6GV59_HAELO|nr:hypothetical protein HPB48_014425 [Haemaphysalis longicornis]
MVSGSCAFSPLSNVAIIDGAVAKPCTTIVHIAAQKIRNLFDEMPTLVGSDYGDLSDCDDKHLPRAGTQAMTDVTVPDESSESSGDEAEEGCNSRCGTRSVDKGHWRKRLLDCSLPLGNDYNARYSRDSTELFL